MEIQPPFPWAKEALVILFRAFPGDFVLVGGAALYWIYRSPRYSADLDLKPLKRSDPKLLRRMAAALDKGLAPLAVQKGVAIKSEVVGSEDAIRVLADGRPALRVELVSLAPVSGREKHLIQTDSLQAEIIVTPDIHQLLFAKAAAFLKRPRLKGRDVFDLWFLRERGANLDRSAFEDWMKWEELDPTDIRDRLQAITPARLRADLARFLPDSMARSLEEDHYKTLKDAAAELFAPFL